MLYLVHFQSVNYDFAIIILLIAYLNNKDTRRNKKVFLRALAHLLSG